MRWWGLQAVCWSFKHLEMIFLVNTTICTYDCQKQTQNIAVHFHRRRTAAIEAKQTKGDHSVQLSRHWDIPKFQGTWAVRRILSRRDSAMRISVDQKYPPKKRKRKRKRSLFIFCFVGTYVRKLSGQRSFALYIFVIKVLRLGTNSLTIGHLFPSTL